MKELTLTIEEIRRCPECGNYMDNPFECDSCGFPYHVPSWGLNPGTGIFDRKNIGINSNIKTR